MRSTTLRTACLSLSLLGIFGLGAKAQPTVVSADPLGNPNAVYVRYSAPMDSVSAVTTANYTLVNSSNQATVPIAIATLEAVCNSPLLTNVVLHLAAPLEVATNYTLTISNVKDASSAFITPNPTAITFYLGGPPGGTTFTFDDGLVPTNTSLALTPPLASGINSYQMVSGSAGFNNTGCLILVSNTTGESFGQWQITNDLANGSAISSFAVSFKFWNVNQDTAGAIGNGLVFHVGPRLPSQYTGGGSSWGNGLDLNFRNFANGTIPMGVNLWWYPPYYQSFTSTWPNQGGGGTIPSVLPFPSGLINITTNWTGYIETNRTAGSFSNYTYVSFIVNNGVANLTCSNASYGTVVLFDNVTIPTWTPITGGSSGLPASFGFTATDGSGNHQLVVVDDVDLTVNGLHVAGNGTAAAVGPVGFRVQPVDVTTNENAYANFSVTVTGAPPISIQWYSNNVAIPGATSASYRTPLTLFSMNNTAYKVAANNCFSTATSTEAVLSIIPDTIGVQALSAGSMNGSKVGVTFSSFVDLATAGNPANYRINGLQPVAAVVRTAFANYGDPMLNYLHYQKTVQLTPASPVSGAFTVTVQSGVLSRTLLPVVQTNLNGVVESLVDTDLVLTGGTVNDPVVAGETFVGGPGQIELIAGGGDFLPIGTTSTDRGHYAYLTRTGNFDMAAKLFWETRTTTAAKAGLMVRSSIGNVFDPTDPTEPAIAVTVFPAAGRNTYETGARMGYGLFANPGVSWAAPGVAANGNVAANWSSGGNWIRIRRLGPYFMGYASACAADGSPAGWTLIGITNANVFTFPAEEWVGLVATAANNDGRLNEADFSNWGPMTFATAGVAITNDLRASPAYVGYENSFLTFSIGATVSNAPLNELVYQWQRKGPGALDFVDVLDGMGNTNSFTTPRLSVATDDGSQYRCIAYVGDLTTGHSATSQVATLSVLLDTNPPYMTAAAADSTFTQITITFDGPMDYTSLANVTHYTLAPVAGGPAISITQPPTPIADPDLITYRRVLVPLDSALTPGAKYLLTVNNLLDSANNNINNTTVPGGRQRVVTGWLLAYGYLKYERWLMPGNQSSSVTALRNYSTFPNSPDVVQLVSYSGYPNGDISNPTVSMTEFGDRISGFLIPPTNGNYNFYLRANDGSVFYMNTNAADINRNNLVVKAVADNVSAQSWLYSATNAAVFSGTAIDTNPVAMVAGQMYYIENQHKQGTGTSYTEFTWGNPTNNAMPTLTSTTTAAGAGGRGGASTNAYNLRGTNIATWVNPDLSVITASGPTNTAVEQSRSATFTVAASAVVSGGGTSSSSVPTSYQWMKNGANIAGATASSYTTPATAYPADNGAIFAVVLSVPSMTFMTITNTAILTVYPDTNAPTVLSASSYGQRTIGIRYDWLMDPVSAVAPANYTAISGGLTVTAANVQVDGQTVLLLLSGPLSESTFSVTINNVKDAAGNTIAPNTIATGNVLYPQMTAIDIGVATNALGYVLQTNATLTNVTFNLAYPGSTVMATDGLFEVTASGRDVTGNQDGMQFVYEPRTGDFDVAVRVDGLTVADALSRAGLMLRENLTPGSRSYQIVADPPSTAAADGTGNGQNKVEVIYRAAQDGGTAAWPDISASQPYGRANPPSLGSGNSARQIPGIWLRLKRVGDKLYAYTGADAINWALVARANLASSWPKTTFVGMCVSAHNNSYYTTAKLSAYGTCTLPADKQALLLVGNNVNTPAGSPNAPQQSSDAMVYTNLLRLGYNVTTLVNETVQAEDAEGKSVVVWSSTGNSGGTGTPSVFTNLPVPLVTWENASPRYLKMVAGSITGTTVGSMTSINITNTADPVASSLTMGMSGTITVNASASMMYVNKADLAPGAVIIAQPGGGTTPDLRTVFFAFEKGSAMTVGTAPQRRVGLFLDDGTPALLSATGWKLLTNAIQWAASGSAADAPTILNQPSNLTVPVGNPATFMVTAVGGSGPYSYQWAKMDGLTPVDIPGAISRDYTILAATLEDAGSYLVKVSAAGSGLSATSATATLQVINTTPASVGVGVASGTLNLSWPADRIGWRLVVQTNTLGRGVELGGTWYTWPNSTTVNSVSIAIDTNAPTVFYRLVYP